MSLPLPNFDDRTYADLVEQARSQIPVEYPAWTDHNPTDTGMILIEMLAWLTEMVLYRVNQVPNDSIEMMLSLLKTRPDTNPDDKKPWRLAADVELLNQLNFDAADLKDNAKRAIALKLAVQQTVLQLRRSYRAVNCDDFEQLVLEWSKTAPDEEKVLRVRCFAEKDLTNLNRSTNPDSAGHVSLVVVPQTTPPIYARAAQRLNFNTDNNQVLISSLKGLETRNPIHTLEAWVYVQKLTSQSNCILLLGQEGEGAHHWLLTADGKLQLGRWLGTQQQSQIAVGAWTHLAVVFDGQNLQAYINGDGSINTQPLSKVSFNLTEQSLRLGRRISNGSDFKGKIAEVRLWNTARTQADIKATMHQRLTGQKPGLVGYWPLDEGSGTTVYDQTYQNLSTLQNQGIITGATWQAEFPSINLCQNLWNYLDDRRLLTTRHHIVLPVDVQLTVSADLYLTDGASVNQVREAANELLQCFFHRSESGPYWQGQGYPIGRSLPSSEIYALLDGIAGVDYVREVTLKAPSKADVTSSKDSPTILTLQPDELIAVLPPDLHFKDRFGNDYERFSSHQ